jgi:hypothetical protein
MQYPLSLQSAQFVALSLALVIAVFVAHEFHDVEYS